MISWSVGVVSSLELDPEILIFALTLSIVATLLFGLLPALSGTRVDTADLGGARTGTSWRAGRLRQAFVIAQLALVVILLVGAALMIRSINAVNGIDLGFEAAGVLGARIDLPTSDYRDAASRDAAVADILRTVRGVPGVEAVAAAQGLPLSGWNVHNYYRVEGESAPNSGQQLVVHVQAVTSGFHELLGVEQLRGRRLRADDGHGNAVAVVNESFVDRHFAERDPIDKRLRFGDGEWITIVGVVADYRHFDLTSPMRPAVYMPWSAWSPKSVALAIRTSRDLEGLTHELQQSLAKVTPNVPPYWIEPLTDVVKREAFSARLVCDLLVSFAGVSVVLALIGLYGVVNFAAVSRRREFGLRVALGATPARLSREIMMQSARLSALGVTAGLLAALGLSGFLSSLLVSIEANDPVTFAGIALMVLVLAGLATWVPAWKVSKQSPVDAIRGD